MRAIWGRFSHQSSADGLAVAVDGAVASPVRAGTRLANYTANRFVDRRKKLLLTMLLGFCFFYGMVFGVFGSFMFAQLLAPIGLLAVLVIWLLPETGRSADGKIQSFFFLYFSAFVMWPDFIALDLPGLPWITAVRLGGFPLMYFFVLSLRMSSDFRQQMWAITGSAVWMRHFVIAYVVLIALSVGFSTNPGLTVSKLSIVLMFYLAIFFISAYVLSKDGNIEKFVYYLWAAVVVNCALAAWEARFHALPWDGHLPSFLAVEDPNLKMAMARKGRAFTNVYRVKGRYPEPLGLAELMVLTAPFIMHLLFTAKRGWHRFLAGLTYVLMALTVNWTDSRFGRSGLIITFMAYVIYWAAQRWRFGKGSVWGPALVIAYPVVATVTLAATFLVGRLRVIVWGGGAQQASSDARQVMWQMGWPKIMSRPWGHGYATAAEVLGFFDPSGLLTIDSYVLSTLLDLGFVGLFIFLALPVSLIIYALRLVPVSNKGEIPLLVPAAIACVNFILVKAVLSQSSNHPLIFIYMGLACAIIYRAKRAGHIAA